MARINSFRQNESIFEIRFKPNAKLIDHRGKWAELIAEHMDLKQWKIDNNRIDVFNDDSTKHLFLGYKNCGMTLHDVPNKEFFTNISKRFLKYLATIENFGTPIQVERIGVRILFRTPYNGSYVSLLKRYSERYLKIPEQSLKTIGDDAVLTDIGGNLNFKDSLGNFTTISGPMPKKQFSNFFSLKDGNFPEVGLYYDIDYWTNPKKNMSDDELVQKIDELFIAGWDRHTRIKDMIIKG